jgi:hypothetical protein
MLASSSHLPYPRRWERCIDPSASLAPLGAPYDAGPAATYGAYCAPEAPAPETDSENANATVGEVVVAEPGDRPLRLPVAAGQLTLPGERRDDERGRSPPSANVLLASVSVDASGPGGAVGCGLLRGW